jgi:NAD(P)-dependent dehydrogenase (short-subunit alcohol dehydrogenase family)
MCTATCWPSTEAGLLAERFREEPRLCRRRTLSECDRPIVTETRFLVTGAYGCIGAWVVHELLAEHHPVTTFDLSSEPVRLRLLLGNRADEVAHVTGDITDLASVGRVIDDHAITNVVHLAALQVPFVRADPPLGACVVAASPHQAATRRFPSSSRQRLERTKCRYKVKPPLPAK